jgi:hypothetical protein
VWSTPTITEITDPVKVAEIHRLFGGETVYQAYIPISVMVH